MDPSSTKSNSMSGSISSATISSSTLTTMAPITTNLVSSSAPLVTSFTLSRPSSATAVPTTVITSAKSAILPFQYCHSNSEQQSKENPNLVSLLSGNSDSMSNDSPPPPPPPPPVVTQNTTLTSILLAKDPEFIPSPPSASPRACESSPNAAMPMSPQSQHQPFFLSEKCYSFFKSSGLPMASSNMPACSQPQTSTKNSNCMIYKGYKKLCNAQSLFKCNKSSTSNCQPATPETQHQQQQQQQQHFNPNHPFGSLMIDSNYRQQSMPVNPLSQSATNTCILSDLLQRGGNKSRKKNFASSDASMDAAANESNDRLSSLANHHNGASITAGVLAATMGDDVMEQPPPATSNSSNNNNTSYYNQLKRRIKKLYHDSDSVAGTESQMYLQKHHNQPEDLTPTFLPRSASDASKYEGLVRASNLNRKSVISKLDVATPSNFQQGRSMTMFCNRMAEFAGYKLPFCQSSSASTVPPGLAPGVTSSSNHQSVNSYLDTLIRSNVARENLPQPLNTSETVSVPLQSAITSSSSMSTSTGSVVSNSVITTVADINPNKPHHFVNLIDKIISNVFITTTTTAAVATGANSNSATTTTSCFLTPTSSLASPPSQSCSSLVSVLSSSDPVESSPSQTPTHDLGPPPSIAPLGPPPTPPSRPPSRPPSTVSAITQLLNSDGSPPASPPMSQPASPCQSHSDHPPTRPSPRPSPKPSPKPSSTPMDCLNDISDKVYQQLIEFEFNHESILKKFQSNPSSDTHFISSSRPGLNPNEKARIEELEKVLFPLQFCLSSMCEQREAIKRNIRKSFFQKNSGVSVDFQRQTLLATTEQAINLLIELTKQLDSFSELSSADQMNLLRTSVMEIMLMRSILIMPQRIKEKISSLKRGLDENNGTEPTDPSSTDDSTGKLLNAIYEMRSKEETASCGHTENGEQDEETLPSKEDMEPCTCHPHDRPYADLTSLDHRRLDELMNPDELGSESSRDSFLEDSSNGTGQGDIQAADYAKQFRAHYIKLARSIDKDWYEDKTIFYLLFAILLFRPTKSNISDVEKVREEHLTYVYLLKRYLENKFKSYCTARSHFIRIFDRLEELQKMNDQVIQKLLDFDLVCAQNLLEKLCIC